MHLQLFGCGSVAQVTTTQEKKGQYLSINLGFALGVTFGIYVSRGVSGERLWESDYKFHLNLKKIKFYLISFSANLNKCKGEHL